MTIWQTFNYGSSNIQEPFIRKVQASPITVALRLHRYGSNNKKNWKNGGKIIWKL